MTNLRRPAARRLWPILLLPLWSALSACSSDRVVTQVEYVPQSIPAELLVCYDAPIFPSDPVTLRDVTLYTLALKVAGQNCRDHLAALKSVVE